MQPNDHKIRNYDLILDETFGKQGTPERAKVEDDAYNFYLGQILQNVSKERGLQEFQLFFKKRLNYFAK
ncbi:MAG: hypothetical protein IKP73_10175 [Bacteroidales bacterium]|nr:hypothetical protein [Bacteroidales bacterium]